MGQPRLRGGKGPAGEGGAAPLPLGAAGGSRREAGSPARKGSPDAESPRDGRRIGGRDRPGRADGPGGAPCLAGRAPGPLRRGRSGEPGSCARGLAAASGVLLHNGGCDTRVRTVCPYAPSQKLRWVTAGR